MSLLCLFAYGIAPVSASTLVGSWNNTTLSTSGRLEFIYQRVGTSSFTLTMNIDGPIFGTTDPSPLIMPGMIVSSMDGNIAFASTSTHEVFGDVSGTLSSFINVRMDMVNIPNSGIYSASIDAVLTPIIEPANFDGTFRVNYTEEQLNGGTEGVTYAAGTLLAVPEPSTSALFFIAASVFLVRRRRD